MQSKTTTIYLPVGIDANTRWSIVANALRAAGITDIRPAPMPSRPVRKIQAPTLISTMEV
jgi:hypothetical protein